MPMLGRLSLSKNVNPMAYVWYFMPRSLCVWVRSRFGRQTRIYDCPMPAIHHNLTALFAWNLAHVDIGCVL